ncbi:MAG: hypothetical protein LBQ94_10725 [Treponema sp.]|nr:hypothetical protein [Treponema sp.]
MKKAILFFTAAIFILSGTGCASSGKAITEQKDPIALVSVISNRDINWKGEGPTNPNGFSLFGNSTLRGDPDMTLVSYADELISTAETLFRNAIDASTLINLADKETALSSRAYQEARANEPARNLVVKPADYRFVNFRDKNFPAALAGEKSIQRIMFVEFDFTKSMYSGVGKNGECRADVDMNIIVLDSSGKTLYNKTFSSWSRSTIRVTGGVYSQTGILELFEEAINEACAALLGSF